MFFKIMNKNRRKADCVRDWSGYEAKASAIVPHCRGGDQRKPPQAVMPFDFTCIEKYKIPAPKP